MIPYADSIGRNDIVAYWGTGYIMLQYQGVWSAYRITEVTNEEVCILKREPKLSHKDAPERVRFTKDEFFEHAMLHRPGLGTFVAPNGEIIHMSWVCARNDKVKSIVPEDIHVTSLGWIKKDKPEEDKPEQTTQALMDHWARTLNVYRDDGVRLTTSAVYPNREIVDMLAAGLPKARLRKPARPQIMSLVMAYLNREPLGFTGAVYKALEVGAAVDDRGLWMHKLTDAAVTVCTGTTKLGVAITGNDADELEFIPVKHKQVSKARVLNGLAERLIPIYDGGAT